MASNTLSLVVSHLRYSRSMHAFTSHQVSHTSCSSRCRFLYCPGFVVMIYQSIILSIILSPLVPVPVTSAAYPWMSATEQLVNSVGSLSNAGSSSPSSPESTTVTALDAVSSIISSSLSTLNGQLPSTNSPVPHRPSPYDNNAATFIGAPGRSTSEPADFQYHASSASLHPRPSFPPLSSASSGSGVQAAKSPFLKVAAMSSTAESALKLFGAANEMLQRRQNDHQPPLEAVYTGAGYTGVGGHDMHSASTDSYLAPLGARVNGGGVLGGLLGGVDAGDNDRDVEPRIKSLAEVAIQLAACDPSLHGICCAARNYCHPQALCTSRITPNSVFDLVRAIPQCACRAGFYGDGRTRGTACTNINECETGEAQCDHYCTDYSPGFACACREGYRLLSDGRRCTDRDECLEGLPNGSPACSPDGTQYCTNTLGSFQCTCKNGYHEIRTPSASDTISPADNRGLICVPISSQIEDDDNQKATENQVQIPCAEGLVPSPDGQQCMDVQECTPSLSSTTPCSQFCRHIEDSFVCDCPQGVRLAPDRWKCVKEVADIPDRSNKRRHNRRPRDILRRWM